MNLGVGTIQPIMIREVITLSRVWSSWLRAEEPGLLYFEFNTFPPPAPVGSPLCAWFLLAS